MTQKNYEMGKKHLRLRLGTDQKVSGYLGSAAHECRQIVLIFQLNEMSMAISGKPKTSGISYKKNFS